MAPSTLALASPAAAVAPRGASRPRRRAVRGALVVRAAARSEFASFFPDEVTALEEPAAIEMAR